MSTSSSGETSEHPSVITVSPTNEEQHEANHSENDNIVENSNDDRSNSDAKPMPWFQLTIICIIRLCEPVSFSVIFPMVTFMIAEAEPNLSEKEIGFYSGTIESIFSFSQFLTIILWGRLSDRIGRKPVILIGLVGVLISTIMFGFSKTFWEMVFARALGGILNGNAAVIKSMIGEITTQDNLALGFSFLLTFFAIGSIIGPLLGGYLSQPYQKFPDSWFGKNKFWLNHEWLLPCLVASLFPLIGFLLGFFGLEETLKSKKVKNVNKDPERQPLLGINEGDEVTVTSEQRDERSSPDNNHDGTVTKNPSPNISELLKDRNLVLILFNYSILSLQTIALEALIVLFAFTPIESGGIGFKSSEIGTVLSISGFFTLFIQIFLFPNLQKRLGTPKLYRFCMAAYPIIFLIFPVIHEISIVEQHNTSERNYYGVWIGIIVLMVLKTSANMVFSCNMILVNSVAPTRDSLGTINGLAQCCASFSRGLSPMIASSLFAISILNPKILKGHLVFYLFSILAVFGYLNSFKIREGQELWRKRES